MLMHIINYFIRIKLVGLPEHSSSSNDNNCKALLIVL